MMGPVLFARGATPAWTHLAAIAALPETRDPPPLRPAGGDDATPEPIHREAGHTIWRYTFALPARADAAYAFDGRTYCVAADLTGDLRIAYVSCNGQEAGDLDRPVDERNALWRRLGDEHARSPFHLLLHGGDQVYADEIWRAHPELTAWHDQGAAPDPDGPSRAATDAASRFYLERYRDLYAHPEVAYLLARVPSLMMWDDHDIFDGWGSHDDSVQAHPVARAVYATARTHFRVFQLGAAADEQPEACPAEAERNLGYRVAFPGFDIIAPDLRSERRPDRVMGPDGWRALRAALEADDAPPRRLVMSSVPTMGPRLSVLERAIGVLGVGKAFHDDLRDQWQSPAHRPEWRALLEALGGQSTHGRDVTVVSGEIHLATRGEMATDHALVHQLVASGIAHPPPPAAWARTLDALARLGDTPIPAWPIRMRPLPGRRGIYAAERNFLVLTRRGDAWSAAWFTEDTGWTPPLDI